MNIICLPQNAVCAAEPGDNLLNVLRAHGLPLAGDCAGRGVCGSCRVRVIDGQLDQPTLSERRLFSPAELAAGWRLACTLSVCGDMKIELPPQRSVNQSKAARLTLPDDVQPDRWDAPAYGVACDIGTTTLAALLWRLDTAELLDAAAADNPQRAYGADVISRIEFCTRADVNTALLRDAVRQELERLIGALCARQGLTPSQLSRITIAGNTVMSHLFLGLSPAALGRAPFQPAYTGARTLGAAECGLTAGAAAEVYVLPNLAAQVGGDLAAGLLASRLTQRAGATLLLDLGTNGELILNCAQGCFTCSTAAGPAFEAASIACGRRAEPGAIERVRVDGDELLLATVDNAPPRGICGSGLIDALAALLDSGVLLADGSFFDQQPDAPPPPPRLAARLRCVAGVRRYVLGQDSDGREIYLDHRDIRQVQLAKSAVRTGLLQLLERAGLPESALDSVLLAGAFGSYVDAGSAQRIGLLPPAVRIEQAGNAAGRGASLALLSTAERRCVERLAAQVVHVELADSADFQQHFLQQLSFPVR